MQRDADSQTEQATAARQQHEIPNCCESTFFPGLVLVIKSAGIALSACHPHVGSSKLLQQYGMLSWRIRSFRHLAIMFEKRPWNICHCTT